MNSICNLWLRRAAIGIILAFPSIVTHANPATQSLLQDKFIAGKYSTKGADSCLMCHAKSDTVMALFAGAHGNTASSDGPMAQLHCESCHGPQGKHKGKNEPMIAFGADGNVSAELQNTVCLSCHQDNERLAWHDSVHVDADVSCVSCHQVHAANDTILARDQQNAVCSRCHTEQRAAMHKRSSHPLENNAMVCGDCHTPHGSLSEAALKQPSVNDSCFECHAEMRGPFLWEHEAVVDDCSNCHNPHGSVNDNLLTRKAPQLCQNCHQPDGHQFNVEPTDGNVFTTGQSCLNCHNQIHGSNHPSGNYLRK
ncbi:DmsE family decaheme c-type cytochrome [Ferrimonas lipolytica]|uniref:DmsE family decaheme c-type cytochrome n=1 Tax=Ferrimonas lipolytica TaxID=2724191 RepID=A0A6H1UB85_9GAMM|nr:DmsE family decaheme c-type cytochrome [Ferrimonas lipolytica]QIZ76304.1 DmsE family decaheme c-type cytochrome [Ferrimonas lipolytica]